MDSKQLCPNCGQTRPPCECRASVRAMAASRAVQKAEPAQPAAPQRVKGSPRKRPPSRATRWGEAASAAKAALDDLKAVQEEYQEWLDNLPENLQSSPVGEKLTAVCELDIEGAQSTAEEAEGIELPLGFGKD